MTEVASEVRENHARVELVILKHSPLVPMQHGMPASVEIEVDRASPMQLVLRAAGQLVAKTRMADPGAEPRGAAGAATRRATREEAGSVAASHRFFAPEVVQTSAMDCGPASLKCLLEGFGVSVSYGRLREACQTDVDGTSIDVIEEVAGKLGLEAEQVMLPLDHLLLPETDALPALLVWRNPDGAPHFVVVWGSFGGRLQVMDPSMGRRWMKPQELLDNLYIHSMPIPAESWRGWAESDEFLGALRHRLARDRRSQGGRAADRAMRAGPGVAELRLARRLRENGEDPRRVGGNRLRVQRKSTPRVPLRDGARRGVEPACRRRAMSVPNVLLDRHRPSPPAEDGTEQVRMRGLRAREDRRRARARPVAGRRRAGGAALSGARRGAARAPHTTRCASSSPC